MAVSPCHPQAKLGDEPLAAVDSPQAALRQPLGLFDLPPDVDNQIFPFLGEYRILYVIAKSGDWDGWEPLVRVAMHQGRGEGRLPMELTSADVEGVGSRAVYDGRRDALRQLSLIGRHLSRAGQSDITLERVNGEDRLGGSRLTISTLQTLPANSPFREIFDENSPVCEMRGFEVASVHDAVLREIRGGSQVAVHFAYDHSDPARHSRRRALGTQQPPVWNCQTVGTMHRGDTFIRVIVLHGDQPEDTFESHIIIHSVFNNAWTFLFTTEPPAAGREGAARFPRTLIVARQVMGADAQVLFGGQLDIALPPAGDGQDGEQNAGPPAPVAPSSSVAPRLGWMASPPQHTNADLGGIAVSSPSAAPAAAPAAAGAGNRGEKRKAAASSVSSGGDGGEGDTVVDERRAPRPRRDQAPRSDHGSSMMMNDRE
ncbi:unnamed protein product [Vitrella brassicaformis CCMP3155]|uniref:Uncharacterized protein n=1 Tax=Vitrella brassicaformis (strain CCMP3155) TaxID=1169540 RepID=A0A0G4ES56_VITBC|nr:unnamed protein product [Vitrella brassicaformis CCMP3155]|eukprot:CEM01339.1 unnamed protein product [Vitrella brassicaformis CCMP3155]